MISLLYVYIYPLLLPICCMFVNWGGIVHVHYSSGGQTGIELSWFTFYTALKYPVQMLVRLGFATFGFHLSILKSTKLSLRTVIFSRKMSKPTAPYGTWKSPISSKLATESSVRFQEIRLDQKPGVVAGVSLNPYWYV